MARGELKDQGHPQPLPEAGGEDGGSAIDPRIQRTRVRAGTLADAVKDVLGAAAGKDTIPILGHVLISASQGTIELTATDLDQWACRSLASADPGEPDSAEWQRGSRGFSVTVPAKVLAAVLGEIAADAMVTLIAPTSGPCAAAPGPGSASADETRLVLKAGRSRFKLPCLPAADFPLPPETPSVAEFEIRAGALADHFARVEHAISSEETRYYLNGVFVHPVQAQGEALTLRFAATDGHRLARLAIDSPEGSASWPPMIIARQTVALLDKLLAGAAKSDVDAMVSVAAAGLEAGSRISFAMPAADGGTVTLVAKTIDGTFPDYGRVIPVAVEAQATIERAPLAAALKRVGVLTAKSSRIVRCAFTEGKLTLTGSSPELGEAAEELPCDLEGEDLTVGFDHQYLRAALLACASDHVVLGLSGPSGPCRIEAVTHAEDEAGPALVQVVMPSRI